MLSRAQVLSLFLQVALQDWKSDFQTDKLWKVARTVIHYGNTHLKFILVMDGNANDNAADGDDTKYTRDKDTVYYVMVVMATGGSKVPLSMFD